MTTELYLLDGKPMPIPDENVEMSFEDLPEDFECPLCGVGKDQFSPIE